MSHDRGDAIVRKMMAADAAILDRLGIRLVSVMEGAVSLAMTIDDTMINSQDCCHGGYLYTLADTAAAYAAATIGGAPGTVDATIAYLRPVPEGSTVSATATVIRAGSRIGHAEVRVADEDGRQMASFRSTFLNPQTGE